MEKIFNYSLLPWYIAFYVIIFFVRQWGTYNKNFFIKYLLTPFITIITIFFVIMSAYNNGFNLYRVFVLIGLVFSLMGDTILMIEGLPLFLFGLIYFLFTHLFYALAFMLNYTFQPWNIAVGVIFLALLVLLFSKFRGNTGGIDIPVLVYISVITIMVYFAFGLLNNGVTQMSVLAGCGAFMFYVSDAVIGISEFLHPLPGSSVIVWSLYAPSQLLIAFSCF